MRSLYLTGLVIVVLLTAVSVSYAGVLHEDVAYWYTNGSQTLTEFNPNTDWLNLNVDRLLVKVQQTVYDQASTKTILFRNGNGQVNGYLYAYSVTNLNVGDASDLEDIGITKFAVGWTTAPILVTTAKQIVPGWVVDTAPQPSWKWTNAVDPGILAGDTVGGFWAVSNTGEDGYIDAHATHVGPLGPHDITGRTTGPKDPIVPDAPTFLSLAAGLIGMGLTKLRRK